MNKNNFFSIFSQNYHNIFAAHLWRNTVYEIHGILQNW
jgi:hypothetical protein